MMDLDSSEEYFSASDSSVYGCDSKEALRAVNVTLRELSRRKVTNSSPNDMQRIIHDQKSQKFVSDLVDDICSNDIHSLRHRIRQVRCQLALQKHLIDQGRDFASEKAALCRLKDSSHLSLRNCDGAPDVAVDARPPRLQISVPQHFSEKQNRRQKSQGVTAWDGSQYMMSLLISLSNKLLVKFCFVFIRDRAVLWGKKKEVASNMFDNRCQVLLLESFAGLKVSWLQHRHDQTAKARGRRHHAAHTQRTALVHWRLACRLQQHLGALSGIASSAFLLHSLRRSWEYMHRALLTRPRMRRKQLCQHLVSREAVCRLDLSRRRELCAVPRPRLDPGSHLHLQHHLQHQLQHVWARSRFSSIQDIAQHYHRSRLQCGGAMRFLKRMSSLFETHRSRRRGERHHYHRLARRGLRAWRRLRARCRWLVRAEDVVEAARRRKRVCVLRDCFRQLCVVRDAEKEMRGAFEAMTPPPIVVQQRHQEGRTRPPLAVSFHHDSDGGGGGGGGGFDRGGGGVSNQSTSLDTSSLTLEDEHDISMDSLEDTRMFASMSSDYRSSPAQFKRQRSLQEVSAAKRTKSLASKRVDPSGSSHRLNYDTNNIDNNDKNNKKNNRKNSPHRTRNQTTDSSMKSTKPHSLDRRWSGSRSRGRGAEHEEEIHVEEREEEVQGEEREEEEEEEEVSSLATTESYLPLLQGLGSASQEQLPLSYRLYTSASMEPPARSSSVPGDSGPESSRGSSSGGGSNGEGVDDAVVRDLHASKSSLSLSHHMYSHGAGRKSKGTRDSRRLGAVASQDEGGADTQLLFVLSCSDSDSPGESESCRRNKGGNVPLSCSRSSSISLTSEVDDRHRRHALRAFVACFYKWKRQLHVKKLLRRVFDHSMTLWEGRYQRRYSTVPFHLLRHIMNIWKFAVTLSRERRWEERSVQRALMFRGISLMARVFVQWTQWAVRMRKKHAQVAHLEHMAKQVCFLGLVMLYQKLQVRCDRASSYFKLRCKRKVFGELFEFAIRSQERSAEARRGLETARLRGVWRGWTRAYKSAVLVVRTAEKIRRREVELVEAYWAAWRQKLFQLRRHRAFSLRAEHIYIRNKAKNMFLRWPGRLLSVRASELRSKHLRNRSRLLALVLSNSIVPFSVRNKVLPSALMHGAFSSKYGADNDSISITSSVSGITGGGESDEENKIDNSSSVSPTTAGDVTSRKTSKVVKTSAAIKRLAAPKHRHRHRHGEDRRVLSTSQRSAPQQKEVRAVPRSLSAAAPLIMPPRPSYYKPIQFYPTPPPAAPAPPPVAAHEHARTEDTSIDPNQMSFQKRAVALGYSTGMPESKKLVRLFMGEIVCHWRVYALKHRDVRRLGLLLQSCTNLRRQSRQFYRWLARCSVVAHRQNTWILPSQKMLHQHAISASPPFPPPDTDTLDCDEPIELSRSARPNSVRMTRSLRGLGYAPPSAAKDEVQVWNFSSHDRELSAATRVQYEHEAAVEAAAEAEAEARREDMREDMREEAMDFFPVRRTMPAAGTGAHPYLHAAAAFSLSAPAALTARASARRGPDASSVLARSTRHPIQLHQVGQYYLGHRHVKYSHVVGEQRLI